MMRTAIPIATNGISMAATPPVTAGLACEAASSVSAGEAEQSVRQISRLAVERVIAHPQATARIVDVGSVAGSWSQAKCKALAGRALQVLVLTLLVMATPQAVAAGIPVMSVTTGGDGTQEYSLTLQLLILMSALTLLPGMVLMMTAFTRIVIVLAILRQALGAGQAPPNQVLIGLALFLTFFVMGPVLDQVNTQALQPYLAGTLQASQALTEALAPLREFMLAQTRESDIATFARIAGETGFERPQDVPLRILVPAFATSELKSAFQIGFVLFIPFIIIDLVVASVLMSMGMMMLSPVLISLPFKLMLFVLVDGWALIMGTLAASFHV